MRPAARRCATWTALFALLVAPGAQAYIFDFTVPSAGGCPQPNRFNAQPGASAINRRWSTSLPAVATIFTVAAPGSPDQVNEIEQTILAAFGAWTGVAGSLLDASAYPSALAPLGRTSTQDACSNDPGTNLDGLDTICFNQSSAAFTTGVLAFTRTFTADAPGQTLGSSGPAAFVGQILQADILFRNDGQATFATPGALTSQPGSYDLESLLIHELGHFLGMDHSAVWRAAMFPFAPAPGTYLGDRPSAAAPDAPLADDDRTGLRALYPDPNDSVNVGAISGRILPANTLSLALLVPTSASRPVTGIFGVQVVAVDADSGAVVAASLGGWSCDPNNPPTRFDGSYRIERLPLGHNFKVYVEPLDGVVGPGEIAGVVASLCDVNGATPCLPPPVNTNFTARFR
jgi:matrixin